MKSTQFLKEGFVEDASEVHSDHEVQMARADLFHAAEDALSLHKLLKNVSEQQGLEGWVAAKITLAADYLKTVREHVEYQLLSGARPVDSLMQTNDLPIAEGLGKDLKRAAQGWGGAQDKPADIVKRNKAYDIDTAKKLRAGMDDAPEHSPQGLQKRVLDRKLKGVAEGTDEKDPNKKQPKKSGLDLSTLRTAAKTAKPASELPKKQNQAVTEMDKSSPQPGRDGRVSHKTYGSRDNYKLGEPETTGKPAKTKDVARQASKELDKAFKGVKEEQVTEMSAGSVATVVNPTPKNKAKVGSLFGGTYKQKKTK